MVEGWGVRPGHEECDRLIAELRRQVAALTEIVCEQQKTIEKQQKTIEEQAARIADLERQLRQDSSNSSKPPSSDPPSSPKRTRKKGTKRKPGGQPGHEGHARALVPVEQVDHQQDCLPSACSACGKKLKGVDSEPLRHQVTEVPPVTPHVSEYRLHQLECTCGCLTRADLPEGVPTGAFGPRLQALVVLFTGAYRVSKRNVVQLLDDCFGVRLSLGSIKRLESDACAALAAPVAEAQAYVQAHPHVHMDETGWRQAGRRAWLWTAGTSLVVVFALRFSRGSKVAKELIGEDYKGILISDRWSGYTWIPLSRRQLCWAHLKRDFQKIADVGGEVGAIGEGLQAQRKKLFSYWHRVRDGTLKRSTLRSYVSPIRAEVKALLRQGEACDDAKTAGMCKALLKTEQAMWTFVRVEGIEPTNNDAERALRHAVIWRKTSFGTQSHAGSVFVERVLTAVGTLRAQGRDVLDYLTATCTNALRGTPAPTLLPGAGASQSTPAVGQLATVAA